MNRRVQDSRLDFSKLKTYSIKDRKSKVQREDVGQEAKTEATFKEFFDALPRLLKARELVDFIEIWARVVKIDQPVIAMCGAHVLKVGLGPLLIQAMREGWVSALALNGAGAVHDFELAFAGKTSEDVATSLENGSFGMVEETARVLNGAAERAQKENIGFGQAIAKAIEESEALYPEDSIILAAEKYSVPVTIHVAIGTDIVHQHACANGAAIGAATYSDFKRFVEVVAQMSAGGLAINFGSAVILPEVFLKALTVARNLKGEVRGFSTANFDMLPQYRPRVNVVERPAGGKGFNFTGHHEIMIPLLFQALAEEVNSVSRD